MSENPGSTWKMFMIEITSGWFLISSVYCSFLHSALTVEWYCCDSRKHIVGNQLKPLWAAWGRAVTWPWQEVGESAATIPYIDHCRMHTALSGCIERSIISCVVGCIWFRKHYHYALRACSRTQWLITVTVMEFLCQHLNVAHFIAARDKSGLPLHSKWSDSDFSSPTRMPKHVYQLIMTTVLDRQTNRIITKSQNVY